MAQSVPREVLDRALRNTPAASQQDPKFGTWAWITKNRTAVSTYTVPGLLPVELPIDPGTPVWFLPRIALFAPLRFAEDTVVTTTITGASPIIDWTATSLPSDGNPNPEAIWASKIAYNGTNTFAAVGRYNQLAVYSNNDGNTWSYSRLVSASLGYIGYNCIGYGGGKFVALGVDNVFYSGLTGCYSTNNCVSWNRLILPYNGNWSDIAYGNNRFVVTSHLTLSSIYSLDGINWLTYLQPVTADTSIAFANGRFVMTGANKKAYYSADGISWTGANLPGSSTLLPNEIYSWSVTYTDDQFIALATSSSNTSITAAYSPDGSNWTYSLAYSAGGPSMAGFNILGATTGQILTYSSYSTRVIYTPNNGTIWYYLSSPFPGNDIVALGAGNGKFVALSNLKTVAIGVTALP